jgi:hypothetical protein
VLKYVAPVGDRYGKRGLPHATLPIGGNRWAPMCEKSFDDPSLNVGPADQLPLHGWHVHPERRRLCGCDVISLDVDHVAVRDVDPSPDRGSVNPYAHGG